MKFPEPFLSYSKDLMEEEYDPFLKSLESASPVSIRMNPNKKITIHSDDVIPWASDAYYLDSRPSFTLDPLFHAGCYYVQEASSMFYEQVIRTYIDKPVKCLDLCAAPGGKSTLLASLLPAGSLLVSNEILSSRADILLENVIKWGNPSCIVTNDTPAAIGKIHDFFDVIVADVPCSGEGMFRKDPAAIEEWSFENVKLCAARQRRIVTDCWNSLSPGGLFVYSTCTLNTEENEENIRWIQETLGAEILSVPVEPEWNICGAKRYDFPVYRFFPHKIKGEGFFLAVLRKKNEGSETRKNNHRQSEGRQNKLKNKEIIPKAVFSWLDDAEKYHFERIDNCIRAFPSVLYYEYAEIRKNLRIIQAGITMGEIKGKDIIPDHNLAMSVARNCNAFPSVELDEISSLHYLRKEALADLPFDIPKGFIMACYKGFPLGFIKNIGSRGNNLYPSKWRIRKSI